MTSTCINGTENYIEDLQNTHEDVTERIPLRSKLLNFKGFQEKSRKKLERREKRTYFLAFNIDCPKLREIYFNKQCISVG